MEGGLERASPMGSWPLESNPMVFNTFSLLPFSFPLPPLFLLSFLPYVHFFFFLSWRSFTPRSLYKESLSTGNSQTLYWILTTSRTLTLSPQPHPCSGSQRALLTAHSTQSPRLDTGALGEPASSKTLTGLWSQPSEPALLL